MREYIYDILLEECRTVFQGKVYTIRPLTFYEIRSGEFARDNIYCQGEKKYQLLLANIIYEERQVKFNKWLSRLVKLNGEPFNLEMAEKEGWEREDFIDLFDIVLEISGLVSIENKDISEEKIQDETKNLIELNCICQYAGMSKDEIRNSTIPYLTTVAPKFMELIACGSFGGLGGLGGLSSEPAKIEEPINCNNAEDFANAINSFF